MKREQMKKMLPILQAYAEGKTVQTDFARKGEWLNKTELYDTDLTAMSYDLVIYRIKPEPEPKYRPFKDAEECWQEMQKHQPFGWLKDNVEGHYYTNITAIDNGEENCSIGANFGWNLEGIFKNYTFADGEPFGVKEEGV